MPKRMQRLSDDDEARTLVLDLPDHVVDLLDDLRPEEVETLRSVLKLGPEGMSHLLDTMNFARSVMTVSKFVRWTVIFATGAFVAAGLLAESFQKFIANITPGGPK